MRLLEKLTRLRDDAATNVRRFQELIDLLNGLDIVNRAREGKAKRAAEGALAALHARNGSPKRRWTPEQLAKFQATMKARRKAKTRKPWTPERRARMAEIARNGWTPERKARWAAQMKKRRGEKKRREATT